MDLSISLRGHYKIFKNGNLVADSNNVITHFGFESLIMVNAADFDGRDIRDIFNFVRLGSQNTPQQQSDTQLYDEIENFVMSRLSASSNAQVNAQRITLKFSKTNIDRDIVTSEIGISSTENGALLTRSTFSEVSFNVGDSIDVEYTLDVVYPYNLTRYSVPLAYIYNNQSVDFDFSVASTFMAIPHKWKIINKSVLTFCNIPDITDITYGNGIPTQSESYPNDIKGEMTLLSSVYNPIEHSVTAVYNAKAGADPRSQSSIVMRSIEHSNDNLVIDDYNRASYWIMQYDNYKLASFNTLPTVANFSFTLKFTFN